MEFAGGRAGTPNGRLLIFDPTDEYTPFGQLRGELQANHGLLVTPDGGELLKLPQLPASRSGVQRTAKLKLSPNGTLSGEFLETRLGDSGLWQRMTLKSVTKEADKIKPIETMLSHSLSTFQITKASVLNLNLTDRLSAISIRCCENYATGYCCCVAFLGTGSAILRPEPEISGGI